MTTIVPSTEQRDDSSLSLFLLTDGLRDLSIPARSRSAAWGKELSMPLVFRSAGFFLCAGLLAAPANAQLIDHKDLSLATALTIATAASDLCKSQGYKVSVTVVGREAQMLVYLRGDGSAPHSTENSFRRAYTALTYREPSAAVEQRVRKDPGDQLVHLEHVMPAQGGLPIVVGGDTLGAVAVSGSPGGEKDEACAKAGIDKAAELLR